jgi:hypothetical protein
VEGGSYLCDGIRQTQLGRTSAGHEAPVARHRLDDIDTIIDSTLDIIHQIRRRSTNDDRGDTAADDGPSIAVQQDTRDRGRWLMVMYA